MNNIASKSLVNLPRDLQFQIDLKSIRKEFDKGPKSTHVLVLAMIDLSGFSMNYYRFMPEGCLQSEVIKKIGQLQLA